MHNVPAIDTVSIAGFLVLEGQFSFVDVTEISSARSKQIVDAARELFGEKGIARTSVKDITEKAGITRSLFYHYFADKEAVTNAVLDGYVEGFIGAVKEWNENRTKGDVAGALRDCVDMFTSLLLERDTFRQLLLKPENAALYLRFSQQSADALARYLTDTTARDYVAMHQLEIDNVYDTFYLLIFGLVGYLRQNPEAPKEVIAGLIANTLHLDLP